MTREELQATFDSKECFGVPVETIVEACRIHDTGKAVHSGYTAYAYYIRVGDNGKLSFKGQPGPCHGFLGHSVGSPSTKNPNIAVFSLTQTRFADKYKNTGSALTREQNIRYYEWLANRSPWKGCHLMKDPAFMVDKGIIIRGDIPSNLMLQTAIASRNAWEFPSRIAAWIDLVDAGADEHNAYCALMTLTPSDSLQKLFYDSVGSDHFPLCARDLTTGIVGAFYNHKFNMRVMDSHLWGHRSDYGRVMTLFDVKGGKTLNQNFWTEAFASFNAKKVDATDKYVHPFTKAVEAIEKLAHTHTDNRAYDTSDPEVKKKLIDFINKLHLAS